MGADTITCTVTITNNFTYNAGGHTLTFGTSNQLWGFNNLFIQDYLGAYTFTALSGEEDHVRGLDVGADSYLPKSSAVSVIVSQAKALLRTFRRNEEPPDRLHIHDISIDRDRYLVYKRAGDKEEELRFPRKEFELLHFLAAHPGKVFTRQELLDQVWGTDVYVVDRTVDVHVRKIREKLGSNYIETVKGVGYKFME